jgi:hypothetical protein
MTALMKKEFEERYGLKSSAAADEAIQLYRNYLFLIKKHSSQGYIISPSVDIDEIWHHHILDTYKYHDDCIALFGQYLHHYPYFGMRGESDFKSMQEAFTMTQKFHKIEFGDYIPSFECSYEEIETE